MLVCRTVAVLRARPWRGRCGLPRKTASWSHRNSGYVEDTGGHEWMKTDVVLGGATLQEQGHNRCFIPLVLVLCWSLNNILAMPLDRNTVQDQRQYRFQSCGPRDQETMDLGRGGTMDRPFQISVKVWMWVVSVYVPVVFFLMKELDSENVKINETKDTFLMSNNLSSTFLMYS